MRRHRLLLLRLLLVVLVLLGRRPRRHLPTGTRRRRLMLPLSLSLSLSLRASHTRSRHHALTRAPRCWHHPVPRAPRRGHHAGPRLLRLSRPGRARRGDHAVRPMLPLRLCARHVSLPRRLQRSHAPRCGHHASARSPRSRHHAGPQPRTRPWHTRGGPHEPRPAARCGHHAWRGRATGPSGAAQCPWGSRPVRVALRPLGRTALLLVGARPSWLLRLVWGMAVNMGASCLRCRC